MSWRRMSWAGEMAGVIGVRPGDFIEGQLGGEGDILLFSVRAVTKSEQREQGLTDGTGRSTDGSGARYQRFPRLDAGQSLFGNRNKVDLLKILAQLMTRNSAPLL